MSGSNETEKDPSATALALSALELQSRTNILYRDLYLGNIGLPVYPRDYGEIFWNNVMESCPFKACMSLLAGGALGAAMGLFLAGSDPGTGAKTPSMKETWREMKYKTKSMGKNFGSIGFILAGTECCIEKYRGKADILNATYSGAFGGFLIGFRAGLRAGVFSSVGFAVFSTGVEYYMKYS